MNSGGMLTPVIAFSGICFCLWTLGRKTWTVKQIIWLMLWVVYEFINIANMSVKSG